MLQLQQTYHRALLLSGQQKYRVRFSALGSGNFTHMFHGIPQFYKASVEI